MDIEQEIEQMVLEHVANVKSAGLVEPNLGRGMGVGSIGVFAKVLAHGMPPLSAQKRGSEAI